MNDKRIASIIIAYQKLKRERMDELIDECASKSLLSDAISTATKSVLKNNVKHSHQRRIPNETLLKFNNHLQEVISQIDEASSFDELIAILEKVRNKGIGTLTIYDVAQRIGAFKRVYPEKIYMHSGTKTGADILGINTRRKKHISKNDLPEPLKSSTLTEAELEDLLCIYKDRLALCK